LKQKSLSGGFCFVSGVKDGSRPKGATHL